MTENKFKIYKGISLLLLILPLIVYVILRAYNLSFTHDESLSYKIITGDKFLAKTANNHLLNTALMYISNYVFGAKEFFLRLPNVLAFILYSFFTYKFLIKANNFWLMLLCASLLLFNPYLLDFFSLARGYGLSLSFGLGSLYFLFRQEHFSTYKEYIKSFSLSLLFSLLAAYSNLICINLNITLLLVFLIELYFLVKNRTILFQKKEIIILLSILFINALFLSYLVIQLLTLKANNELYFGGKDNFIDNTLTTLLHRSIYLSYYGEQLWQKIRQGILALFGIAIIYQIYGKKNSSLNKITVVLFVLIFAAIMQHYVFDALYAIERTTLIFVPIFALFVFYLFSTFFEILFTNKYSKTIFNLICFLFFFIPIGFHLIKNINLKYTKEWTSDADVKTVMKIIVDQQKENSNKKITISNTWFFEPTINYYKVLYKMTYLNSVNRNGVDTSSNYIYCTMLDKDKLNLNNCYIILQDNDDIETVLVKKICK